MASGNCLALLLWLLTILFALECSNANVYQEQLGRKRGSTVEKDVSHHTWHFCSCYGRVIFGGRKNFHMNDENQLCISVKGNSKLSDPRKTHQEPQKDSDHARTQVKQGEAFLVAVDEVANLMRKDYRGAELWP